ncbi:uncharacterized protein LOC133217636 [Neopsephotus bourkii]|uniref:uncharacterized protein LOC133217636 n=1 Tax=Neopsephotus bourkii TaxID=309878 RepID=UPI002AA51770|nr:uncharacterized protein LOC133217636 [Neopsephotus bourkii]
MWRQLLSHPVILPKVLRELSSNLQHLRSRSTSRFCRVKFCIYPLSLLASSDVTPEEFAGMYNTGRFSLSQNEALFSLTVTGLITLSQSPDTARKILVLLPDLIHRLQRADSKNRRKMLLVFRNVMGHLKKEDSSTTLQLAEKLLQLFDDVSSQVQELSICLFKEILQMADRKHQRQMQKIARESLVPLMLHMSDETESVAKASHEAFCVAAKVLKLKRLSHNVQAHEIWRTAECLLEQDRSRAEEYVRHSMPYLQHTQVTMRSAAVRFIGEPQSLESLLWQPGPSPICCTGCEEQPCACQSPSCPVQGLCSQGLCASPSYSCSRSRAWWHLAQCHLPSGPVLPWGHPAEGREGVQPNWQSRGQDTRSVLGSSRSDRALCTGLATQYLKDSSKDRLQEILEGE